MAFSNHVFQTSDDHQLTLYRWDCSAPKAVMLIVHGMSEHAARYDRFASFMVKQGVQVVSCDLRGHGKTAGSLESIGFFAPENGWSRVVKDVSELAQSVQMEFSVPLFMFGHSMGSFISRTVLQEYPNSADFYVFSSTAGHPGFLGIIGKPIAQLSAFLGGKRRPNKFLSGMTFDPFSKRFKPTRTMRDWISRDEAQVDAYVNDPWCMQPFTSQFFVDLATGVLGINSKQHFSKVPKDKGIYLFAGDMDPVGDFGKGPRTVAENYRNAGVQDVTLKIYPGGRHEMLNEINYQEVYQDIIDWVLPRV